MHRRDVQLSKRWWRSKLGWEKHLMLWRRFYPGYCMNDHVARALLSPIYLSMSVFHALSPLKGSFFLPAFFSSFDTSSGFTLFFPPIYYFIFPSPLLFLASYTFLLNIFLYCSKTEGARRNEEVERASAYASIKVHPYTFIYFLLLLCVPLCSYAEVSRCLRKTLLYSLIVKGIVFLSSFSWNECNL